ncbi:MAG: hypothetical protein OJF55_000971 [Rhodanobacteraceae bacterium]|nr:MAG: hypothetical protein OJF55_000971 [Rhodanobacteraceae bacterium]
MSSPRAVAEVMSEGPTLAAHRMQATPSSVHARQGRPAAGCKR